jgi:hypothetical protein
MELLNNVKPTCNTKKATANAAIYSNLPCPKGCSLSAGLLASFTPKKLIMEEAASERLLKASAVTEILLMIHPTVSFTANRVILQTIPTILDRIP